MKKSLISWITVLALCLSLLPTAALAEGDGMEDPAQEQGELVSVPEQPQEEDPAAENETGLFSNEDGENGIALFSGAAHSHDGWTAINSRDELLAIKTAGNYYLTDNINLLGNVWHPADDVVLCLNGHDIVRTASTKGDVITVDENTTFTLTDCAATAGKITHIEDSHGAGVSVSGTFNMSGGSISGNDRGVSVNSGTFNMSGGSISGNSNTDDASYGVGVFVNDTLIVSGSAVISGNTSKGKPSNVAKQPGAKLLVDAPLNADASIGLSPYGYGSLGDIVIQGTDSYTLSETDAAHFFSDNSYTLEKEAFDSVNHTQTFAVLSHMHTFCNNTGACNETGHRFDESTQYNSLKPWTETDSLPSSGSYYLTGDVTLDSTWTITYNVNLCLNGYSITMVEDGDVIAINNGKLLRLADCNGSGQNNGKITHAGGASGRGVSINNGSFYMFGGSITGNATTDNGGGVYLTHVDGSSENSFHMLGGSITDNSAANGGGVYIDSDYFHLYGGTIENNTVNTDGNGGGVYVSANNSFFVYGGYVRSNTASNVYLPDNVMLKLDPSYNYETTGASDKKMKGTEVYVTVANPSDGKQIATISTAQDLVDCENVIKSDMPSFEAEWANFVVTLTKAKTHTHYLCGGDDTCTCPAGHTDKQVTFVEWTDALAQAQYDDEYATAARYLPREPGNYCLTTNVTRGYDWSPKDGTVLCLNGYSITTTEDMEYSVISVTDNRNFTLCDCQDRGKITRASRKQVRIVEVNSGTFNLYGGELTNGYVPAGGGINDIGGCVLVYSQTVDSNNKPIPGTFNMYGGSITGGTSASGGGVGIYGVGGTSSYSDAVSFNMYGGSITGNMANYTQGGCGVYVKIGEFNMYGGSIANNYAGSTGVRGGGVFVAEKGTFNMSSGSITGNTTTITSDWSNGGYGGGVYVDGGAFNMSGGMISGNTANDTTKDRSGNGGGVYVGGGTFTVSGNPQITGNKIGKTVATATTTNNVYLPNNKTITIGDGDGLTEGASIGVTTGQTPTAANPVTIATNAQSGDEGYFTSDVAKRYPVFENGEVQLTINKPHTHFLCGGTTECTCPEEETAQVTFQKWTDGNSLPDEAGCYSLATNVKLSETWTPANGTVLCLNGKTITADGDFVAINIAAGGSFTLVDCSGNKGTITHADGKTGSGVYVDNGSFTMYGGNITRNTAKNGGGVDTAGSFTMYGGTISDNTAQVSGGSGGAGGGVHADGNFTMYGGTISGNNATDLFGGGMYVAGDFIMNKGTISGNTAGYGGGVFAGGDFTMNNGTISGNTTTSSGGGGVYADGDFTMKNGKITGNTAKTDYGTGGGVYAGGDFTMENGEISDNTAEGSYSNGSNVSGAGGGVYTEGSFTMSGGTISGNKATYGAGTGFSSGNGGGVFVGGNSFTMTGGTISNNMAASNGGGVCVNRGKSYGTYSFTMTGGTITGNSIGTSSVDSTGNGGGVWTNSEDVQVSGSVKVTGNTKYNKNYGETTVSAGENNFFYVESLSQADSPLPIKIGESGLKTGASIGISVDNYVLKYLSSPITVVTNATAGDLKYFSADAGEPFRLEFVPASEGSTTGTIVLTTFVEHEHKWTYALKEDTTDTIIATCKVENCTLTDGYAGSVTIKAPEHKVYGDGKPAYATLVTSDDWVAVSNNRDDIRYYRDSVLGDYLGSADSCAPSGAGTYVAQYSVLGGVDAIVTYTIEKADPSYTVPTDLSATYGQTLANITLPDGWSWVDGTQSVGSVGSHTFKATFTPSDKDNYNTVTVDVTVTVNKAAGRSLGEKNLTQKYTDTSEHTVTLDWSALPAGQTWSYGSGYSVSTGSQATLTKQDITAANGELTYAISGGKADETVTITLNASCNNYEDFTWTVKVTLTDKETQTLTFASSMTKTYGDGTFKLTATNNRSDGGAITYTSSVPSVATVDRTTGEVTILKAGETVITATADATSDYAEGSARCTLTVNKATITIKAKDLNAYVGDAVPTPDYTVTGLVGSDALTTPPTIAYETTPDMSKAGTFRIIVSGAEASDNYSIEYVNGTLTVAARQPSGGGITAPVFPIGTPDAVNGTITVTPKTAPAGATVTIVTKPNDGYQLGDLSATDKDGNQLPLTDKGDGKYTFVMPNGTVNVRGSFVVKTEESPFLDVSTGAYYYDAVKWAVGKDITSGIGNGLFGPNQSCTRAQIVTFLWRAAGSPEPAALSSFTDVAPTAYYAKAVAWAVENGVTTGTSATEFSPNEPCTRAQAVTFLYRALKAAASGSNTAFSDVAADAYYASAVAWAVENGVTTGVGGGLFAPKDTCTRAQIVTFLYRAYQGK